jgi:hypothetical protein
LPSALANCTAEDVLRAVLLVAQADVAHKVDHKQGATDPAERARLRAELDGLVAHLYGLTLESYRAVEKGQVR